MKVVGPEFEILRVAKPVRPPFEGLYFVCQAIDGAACYAVIEIVEKSRLNSSMPLKMILSATKWVALCSMPLSPKAW